MAFSYAGIYTWARLALRTDVETTPDTSLTLLAVSSYRRLSAVFPLVATHGGVDLASLSVSDRSAWDEAVGYLVAARWVMLPRPDGEEIIIRSKIAQLEETYQVPSLDKLMAFYQLECKSALGAISFIADARREAAVAGQGVAKIVIVNPTRHRASLSPNGAGALSMLFSSRQLGILGDDFNSDGLQKLI